MLMVTFKEVIEDLIKNCLNKKGLVLHYDKNSGVGLFCLLRPDMKDMKFFPLFSALPALECWLVLSRLSSRLKILSAKFCYMQVTTSTG